MFKSVLLRQGAQTRGGGGSAGFSSLDCFQKPSYGHTKEEKTVSACSLAQH